MFSHRRQKSSISSPLSDARQKADTNPFEGSASESSISMREIQTPQIEHQGFQFHMPTSASISEFQHSAMASPSATPSTRKINEWMEREEAYRIMSAQIYRQAQRARLFSELDEVWNGVALRFSRNQYVAFPSVDSRLSDWLETLKELNPQATLSVTSAVVTGVALVIPVDAQEICLETGERLQVIERMPQLALARKAQGACFIRSEGRLLVWTDTVETLIPAAKELESKLLKYMWNVASQSKETDEESDGGEKKEVNYTSEAVLGDLTELPSQPKAVVTKTSKRFFGLKRSEVQVKEKDVVPQFEIEDDQELETDEPHLQRGRKVMLLAPLYTGLGVGLNIALMGGFIRNLLIESLLDNDYMRMGLALVIPPLMCIVQFMCDNVVGVVAQLMMPISQMKRNSLYYSGKVSQPSKANAQKPLPHFTIQMPVYKEGLDSVLIPTIESVKEAISIYELKGGSANMMICEDGMQLLSPEEYEVRRDYYDRNDIGWVARPKHGANGYIRKGRFKKASNLNFSCDLSLRVEEIMDEKRSAKQQEMNIISPDQWFQEDEAILYKECLKQAVEESEGRAWAAGDIRIGDYILLIDSDTRVPKNCFIEAAWELDASPEVGVLQHCSGVMFVANHYFEKMIGFFTKIVNFSISWCVANGSVAPLVGHNAFLRWSALQEVIYTDDDGERCVWSTKHVSEDFDMALRLLMKGYIVRWATYSNNEFLEGVSLTPDDEINRWQKYAFGCSELVFNPLRYWFTKGPLTPLFRKFLWSKCPTAYKVNACSYIFSYWAIAVSTPLTIGLFVAQGLFYPLLDPIFLTPFQVWIAVIVVFVVGGNVGMIICRSRAGHTTPLKAIVEHVSWIPALTIFFSGISYHVMLALLAHPFGYNMTWSATIKDFDENESNFWLEVPAILKRYWHCFTILFIFGAGMILLSTPLVPMEWRVEGFAIFWPGALLIATQ